MNHLFERMMDDCVMMDKRSIADGIGGFVNEWTDGAHFPASIETKNGAQVVIGEKDDYTVRYLVTTRRTTLLGFHDVIKRVEDGAIFRIVVPSVDRRTPTVATFEFAQAEAERWVLA